MIKRKDGFSGERALVLPSTVIAEITKDPLANSLYITDIGYYPRAQYHFRERKTPISQYILIYCTEGCGWIETPEKEYLINKNQCIVIPAGTPHCYGADNTDPWTIYWIHFKGTLAALYAKQLYSPVEIKPNIYSRIKVRLSLFEEIYHALEMGFSKDNILYASSALHYFLGTICYLQQYRNATSQNNTTDFIDTAIHFMKENLGKKMAVEEIARHTGYSVSHFSALFCKRTGYTPIHYFNLLKIQYACNLLDKTDIQINQLCYKVGIDDCYYFSRLFTKIMGISPSVYKKQKKG